MCRFTHERSKDSGNTEVVGNETLIGQLATFMDSLHLSYKEAFEEIPYRVMLIMQKDKLHASYGDVIKKTTARELGSNIK